MGRGGPGVDRRSSVIGHRELPRLFLCQICCGFRNATALGHVSQPFAAHLALACPKSKSLLLTYFCPTSRLPLAYLPNHILVTYYRTRCPKTSALFIGSSCTIPFIIALFAAGSPWLRTSSSRPPTAPNLAFPPDSSSTTSLSSRPRLGKSPASAQGMRFLSCKNGTPSP